MGRVALGSGEQGHCDHRNHSQNDSRDTVLGVLTLPKSFSGIESYIGSKDKKADSDQLERALFHYSNVPASAFGMKSPEENGAGDALDGGIEAESDQGNAAGEESGSHGNRALYKVPADGDVLQRDAAADLLRSCEWFSGHNKDVSAFGLEWMSWKSPTF